MDKVLRVSPLLYSVLGLRVAISMPVSCKVGLRGLRSRNRTMNFRARPWRGPQECLALPAGKQTSNFSDEPVLLELYVSEIREIARETYALLLKNYDSVLVQD